MNFEQICSIFETQAQLNSICTRIFNGESFIKFIMPYKSEYANDIAILPFMSREWFEKSDKIQIVEFQGLLVSRVIDKATNYCYIFGPVCTKEITDYDISQIFNTLSLPKLYLEAATHFLQLIPLMTIENFLLYTQMENIFINNEVIPILDIIEHNNISLTPVNVVVLPKSDGTMTKHIPAEYEEQMIYLIKNGLVDEIDNLKYDNFKGAVGKMGSDFIRSIKNALISMNALCMRAAVSGGVNRELACRISDKYIQRIEEANSIESLGALSALIRKDYCTKVNKLTAPKIENLHILKATQYIKANIYSKITTKMIADQQNIIPTYLGQLFRRELNCTIPEYVLNQKITEAKKLLRFTDKSLAEIASLLSFSSQSYFQSRFKEIRKMTPAEYRAKYGVVTKKG